MKQTTTHFNNHPIQNRQPGMMQPRT